MFSIKFNRYLKESGCSAKDFSAMTDISEATISRYRMGKTVPAVNSGKVELIAETFAELLNEKGKKQEIYEDLLIAAYEDLEAVDYRVYSQKLSELIDSLKIVRSKLAEEIHISNSYISRICSGQVKPRNPVYIAEVVARYVAYNYSSEDDKKIVSCLIGDDSNEKALASTDDYFRIVRRWLLKGENYRSRMVENLFYKYNDFSKNDFLEFYDDVDLKAIAADHKTDMQTFSGGEGFRQGFLNWVECACSSKLNDEIFIFDEILSSYAREKPEYAAEYFGAIEKLVKAGKKITVIHNVECDMYVASVKCLCWIPLNVSGRLKHLYINEPKGFLYRNTLMTASNCAYIGNMVGDEYDNGYYMLTTSASEVLLAKARFMRLMDKAELSYRYCENRGEFDNVLAELFSMVEPEDEFKVYLPLPSHYTMTESFLLHMLRNNGVPESRIPSVVEQFRSEQAGINEILKLYKTTIYLNYISEEAWERSDVTFDVYGEKLTYTRADYEEHMRLIKEVADRNPKTRLVIKQMLFYKNLFLLIVPVKYFVETTYNKMERYLVGTDPVTVGGLDTLMKVVARDDPEDTKENRDLYSFIQGIVKK